MKQNGFRQAPMGLAAFALAGCTTMGGEVPSDPGSAAMVCNAESAQRHVGQTANQAIGAAILTDSGARTLRWGAPNTAWTRDYRQDRVNVRYDGAMTIIEITCG